MNTITVSPPPECENCSYVLVKESTFPENVKMIVPMGFEAAAWKDPYSYTLCYPGEHLLQKYLPAHKIGFRQSELHGRIGFINKQLKYKLSWGTGSKVVYNDPTLAKACDVGFSGSLILKVDMSDMFLQHMRNSGKENFRLEYITKDRMPVFSSVLNQTLRQAIMLREMDYRTIPANLSDLSIAVTGKLREIFLPFGIWMDDFAVENYIFSQDVEALL